MAHAVRAGYGKAASTGNDDGTTMIAELSNGVNHPEANRLLSPSSDADDSACHYGTQPSPNGDNGRDTSGRFAQGNAGGPGNPFGRLMARLRSAFYRRITEEDVEAIADKLLEKARACDVAAARLLLSYGIGKPTEAVNPDTLDLQEWDVFRKSPVSMDDLRGIVEGIPADVAGPLVRSAKPYLNSAVADQVMKVLMPEPPPEPKLSRKERREARRRRRMAETVSNQRADI